MCKAENGLGLPDTAAAVLEVLREYKPVQRRIIVLKNSEFSFFDSELEKKLKLKNFRHNTI